MRALLLTFAVVVLVMVSLVIVHEYGQYKYMKGIYDATHLDKYLFIEDSLHKLREEGPHDLFKGESGSGRHRKK